MAIASNYVESIRPGGVGGFRRVVDRINECGQLDTEVDCARVSEADAVFVLLGIFVDDVFLLVGCRLPCIAGMSLLNIDEEELRLILVLLIELVERGNLPAKGRSGVAAEYQDNRFLSSEGRESYFG